MDRINFVSRKRKEHDAQAGQTNILVMLALGIFFLGFLGFAVDYSNLWFHRQTAQAAADAACQAGAMDLLVNANGGSVTGLPSPIADFDCVDYPGSAPCQYAQKNGYTGSALTTDTPGTQVLVSFPGSIPGVPPPPTGFTLPTNSFMRVDVLEQASVFFSGLLTQKKTANVRAFAGCGLQLAKAPIPIIVLNPSCKHPFEVSGSATLKIVGGPNKSVQVNSNNQTCAAATVSSANQCSGSGTIDLSHGGPSFTGSNFGVFGAPAAVPSNFNGGSTGAWLHGSPIGDPYANVPAPSTSGMTTYTDQTCGNANSGCTKVNYGVDGCPDHSTPVGCQEYHPGLYTYAIDVKGFTAIFVPGIYYIKPTTSPNTFQTGGGLCGSAGSGCTAGGNGQCRADFLVESGGIIRPASNTATGSDGSNGVMFYLSGQSSGPAYGSAVFTSSAGTSPRTVDQFTTTGLTCDGSNPDPGGNLGIGSSVDGNILVAQCTHKGNYYQSGGPSNDTVDTSATGVRGLLFFQDRANGDQKGQMNMQGGGGFALSGTLYAHNCPNSTTTGCTSSDYSAFVDLQGTPGSGTYLLGEIVSDQLVEAGNGSIAMSLNPNAVYYIFKVALLR